MKRKEFEDQMIELAFDRMMSNMEWGLQRIQEFHHEPESVIDQVYGFNMGVIAVMPDRFYTMWLDKYTDTWNEWLTKARA